MCDEIVCNDEELTIENIFFNDSPRWYYYRFKEIIRSSLDVFEFNNFINYKFSFFEYEYRPKNKKSIFFDERYIFSIKAAGHLKNILKTKKDIDMQVVFLVPARNIFDFKNMCYLMTNSNLNFDVYNGIEEFVSIRNKYFNKNVFIFILEISADSTLLGYEKGIGNVFPYVSLRLY